MKLKDLYEFIIAEGMKVDPRTKVQVNKYFSDKRKEYNALRSSQKKFFDKECFKNPYADTRILYGDPKLNVKRIMIGIDIEVGELLLADQLSLKGDEIDLVIAHHPEGYALAGLDDVMHMQADFLKNAGIKDSMADSLMKARVSEVSRRLHSVNHTRAVDAAKLLDIPMMCVHTPADNHVSTYLQKLVNKVKPKTLQSVCDLLMKEPEYKEAAYTKAGPEILIGKSKDKAGKIYVDMTGGTEGSKEIFARMSQLGIDTMLGMHYSEMHYQNMKREGLKVVNAGHMASDNLGLNLLLDKIEKKTDIEVIACSGFKRFKRSRS